ncbi:putative rRNA-processing protein ebp2 [Leucoagaricus sp. SymC.cos]|nr:putative rRNA-processing protein ebp2 [Leucoagaricus sp. SymC.cos]
MAKTRKQKAAAAALAATKSSTSKNKDKDQTKLENKKPVAPVIALAQEPSIEDLEEDEEDDKARSSSEDEDENSEDEGVDEEGMERLMKLLGEDGLDDFDRAQLQASDSDEEKEDEDEKVAEEAEDSEDDEGEDAVPLDEVESVDEDAVPQQKLEVDNEACRIVALGRIRQTIQLDPSLPWTETLALTYPEKIGVDVDDDLNRELAFYKQALHSAQTARTLASKHNFPFTRPSDYFAEMVKSDAHMERIRQRLLNESAGIKKSEEKRKEREGKKFGKRVQMEKLKERERSKKEMDERLKNLKRKRKDMLDNTQGKDDDDFDVAVENAISDRPSKRGKFSEDAGKNKARMPRQARDKKFGFGGAGRRAKQNTKESTNNFGPGAGRGKRGKGGPGGKGGKKPPRPGKSKRMAARSKS